MVPPKDYSNLLNNHVGPFNCVKGVDLSEINKHVGLNKAMYLRRIFLIHVDENQVLKEKS